MRAHLPQILLAALLASATAGAAPVGKVNSGAAPVAYQGAYSVTFTMNVGAGLAPGTTFLCKARALPPAPALEDFRLQALPATSGEAAGASLSASTANCTVEIPFYWIAGGGLAVLNYEIDAVNGYGGRAVPVRIEEGIGIPLPAPGGTARLNISVSF